jgi:NDP-sugar pyrophosphorylase family protein
LKTVLPRLRDEFYLLNGDTFLPLDYRRLEEEFSRSDTLAMVTAFPIKGTGMEPTLLVVGSKRTGCSALSPRRDLTHADAGVRLVRRGVSAYFPAEETFSLEEALYPRLIKAGRISAWSTEERFYDIGTPERVLLFERYLSEMRG